LKIDPYIEDVYVPGIPIPILSFLILTLHIHSSKIYLSLSSIKQTLLNIPYNNYILSGSMNVMSEKTITDIEAKEILENREKEGELRYEQKNALELLKKFVRLDKEKSVSLSEELAKIEKLRERQIVAIINFLPEDRDDLRAVLQKEYSILTDDEINLVLETVKKYS
jgi:DNA-directed RNA polymerase subunit F